MNAKITVLIVNYNTAKFIATTLDCLSALTKNSYKVIIADNNSSKKDFDLLSKIVSKHSNVTCYRKEGFQLKGSMAHGTTLNELVAQVKTPYFSILDADATWLENHWDEKLIKELQGKTKLIGTPPVGAKSKEFPLMFAILLETKTFQSLNIDFRPPKGNLTLDTGYELQEKYTRAGYTGKCLTAKNTRTHKNGPFAELVGVTEYYNTTTKNIIAAHFGRGSSLGKAKYKKRWEKILYQLPYIGQKLIKQRAHKEQQAWRRICHELITKQT